MSKLIELLNKNKLTLIAALPANNLELAKAAIDNGIDALQLHVNITGFKSLEEEQDNLLQIVEMAKIPVGIVPGKRNEPTKQEIKKLQQMGFDFLNLDMDHLPPFMSKFKGPSTVVGLNSRFSLDRLVDATRFSPDVLHAAIVPTHHKGQNLVISDLQNYISIVISSGLPVIIPTQRDIKPSEVAIIADTGARGLMLTAVVTGTTAKHIALATSEFRAAVDDLGD